ncbi:hypothetical protein ACWOEQ_03545 [Enterococcus asini]|uniref:hypothetical protein n=1 Tax=Enterococcus asini TaxID=57732 RepID=UPI00091126EF|nr:hypothetical protein [Enterococcus asini]OJG12706.1 hypothetical protein RU94_GL001981 [Enterococcus asini]
MRYYQLSYAGISDSLDRNILPRLLAFDNPFFASFWEDSDNNLIGIFLTDVSGKKAQILMKKC